MSIIGKQILDILTAGMYSDPLMVLREYVQNAVDSIDEAVSQGLLESCDAQVSIETDGKNRNLSITDNGVGIAPGDIEEVFCSVGVSTKDSHRNRGFRGIGRLGGIGYCDRVVFSTKSVRATTVTECTWDATSLKKALAAKDRKPADAIVQEIVETVLREPHDDEGGHFFKVTLYNVHKFHRDTLMDPVQIRSYLSSVSPVPFDNEAFSFAGTVEGHLSGIGGYGTYNILFNNEPVLKHHTDLFKISEKSYDTIQAIKCFDVKGRDGSIMGRGWYAETNYLASLPPRLHMRGIHVRQGNIEIGDEYFLADHFSERRFTTWHIGEIHVANDLRPNARRDGFEETAETEVLMEYAGMLGRHLSNLCRESSKNRSKLQVAERKVDELAKILEKRFFIDEEHRQRSLSKAEEIISNLKEMDISSRPDLKKKFDTVRKSAISASDEPVMLIDAIDGRTLKNYSGKEILADVCSVLLDAQRKNLPILDTMYDVISPFLKKKYL